jgi:hypothetical protein
MDTDETQIMNRKEAQKTQKIIQSHRNAAKAETAKFAEYPA